VLRTAAAYVMLLAATAHAARLPELAAAGSKTRVRGSTRISVCFIRLEVRQAPKTHRGNAFSYDGSAVGLPDDLNGNLLTETKTPTGLPAEVTSYAWDKDNRLRSVTPPTGAPTTYAYGANGIRTQRVDATGAKRYLLDGRSVLAELDGANTTTTSFMNNPQMIDDVLAYQRGSATEYPLTDALGSVYAATDATGAVVHRYDYDVFGVRTDLGGSSAAIDLGFTNRWHDPNGIVDHNLRQRNPRLGGWLSPDPLGFVDGPNRYGYVGNQPTMLTDPLGLAGFDSPTMHMLAALARGDIIGAAYYLEVAVGLSEGTAIGVAVGLTTALGLLNRKAGECINSLRAAMPHLQRLGQALGTKPEIVRLTTRGSGPASNFIGFELRDGDPSSTVQVASNSVHFTSQIGTRFFDAFTGPGGMEKAEYLRRLVTHPGVKLVAETVDDLPPP